MYQPRTYRQLVGHPDLVSFEVRVQETDLQVAAVRELAEEALQAVGEARQQLHRHIRQHPAFLSSLEPLAPPADCPALIRGMYAAAAQAGVGPMAAVAGAVAEYVGNALLALSPQVIVENGGDIFLQTSAERTVAIYAGPSPLSGKLGLRVPANCRLGICTSSGTVGHSLSFGRADAALVVSADTALADAVATALGNRVSSPADVGGALEWVQTVREVRHALVIVGETLGAWGELELVRL